MTHFVDTGTRTARPEELSLPEKVWVVLTGVTVPRPTNERTPQDANLRYEMRLIEIGKGEKLEAWYVPAEGPRGLVLMFPGYAMSKDSLLEGSAALYEMGWSTLLVDYRGVGGSSGENTTLGIREAEDVAAAARYAREEWPGARVVLYGVSMGSAAVLRAVAVEGAEADGLILESPFDTLLNTVRNRFGTMGLPGWPGAELVVFWGGTQIGVDGFAHNPAEYARSVRVPTLLMHGEHDPRATMEQAQSVYDNLGGSKSFVEFRGAGHEALLGVDVEAWKEQVHRFLSEGIR
jgi:alpha-beta hydrolase superfamily lysophospholipase